MFVGIDSLMTSNWQSCIHKEIAVKVSNVNQAYKGL